MAESLHERYDADERRLLDTAVDELWTNGLLDMMVDVSAYILDGATWRGTPDDAPPRWTERSTAALALAAMALRATRTVAMAVRSGYAPEALGLMRRLFEVSGHAAQIAHDDCGQYAENWLHGRGKAGKPRAAFGPNPEDDPTWRLMSGQAHAEFAAYANLSGSFEDDRVLTHQIAPRRDHFWDSLWLWLAARQLACVLACVLKVHPQIDDTKFLDAGRQLISAEHRIEAEMTARRDGDLLKRLGLTSRA